jgi:hypothetical protein
MVRNKTLLYTFFVLLMAAVMLACSLGGSGSKAPASMAGKWLDPDTTGTITTIQAQGDGFVVVSVMNPERGVNELTDSSWDNGVLSWTYCPDGMHCIVSKTVSVTDKILTADWSWADGGNGGTTKFERQP